MATDAIMCRLKRCHCKENDQGDTIFVVVNGLLRIYFSDSRGREVTMALYGPGEYAGEMSLDGGPRSASVITETASTCAMVSGQALRQHLEKNPDFALELIRRLIRRTRFATESARSMALLDAYGRLTRLFDGLAVTSEGGARCIKQRLTHLDISQRIGCSREFVSRILKDLETGGYIALKERQYSKELGNARVEGQGDSEAILTLPSQRGAGQGVPCPECGLSFVLSCATCGTRLQESLGDYAEEFRRAEGFPLQIRPLEVTQSVRQDLRAGTAMRRIRFEVSAVERSCQKHYARESAQILRAQPQA